jgi:alginate O-acetyltransferase complex protein AlgI
MELLQMVLTFFLITSSTVFFRAPTVSKAFNFFDSIWKNIFLNLKETITTLDYKPIVIIILLITVEWIQRRKRHVLEIDNLKNLPRYVIYILAMIVFIYFGQYDSNQQFIYFQF